MKNNTEARLIRIEGPQGNVEGHQIPLWSTDMMIGPENNNYKQKSVHIRSLLQAAKQLEVNVNFESIDYSHSQLFRSSVRFFHLKKRVVGNKVAILSYNKESYPDDPDDRFNEVITKPLNPIYHEKPDYGDQMKIPTMSLVEGYIEIGINRLRKNGDARDLLNYEPPQAGEEYGRAFGGCELLSNEIKLTPTGIEIQLKMPIPTLKEVTEYKAKVELFANDDGYFLKLLGFLKDKNKEASLALEGLLNETDANLLYLTFDTSTDVPSILWPLAKSQGKLCMWEKSWSNEGSWKERGWRLQFGSNAVKARMIHKTKDQNSAADIISPLVYFQVGENEEGVQLVLKTDNYSETNKEIRVTQAGNGTVRTNFTNETIKVHAGLDGLNSRFKDLYRDVNGFKNDEETLYAFTPLERGWLQLPFKNNVAEVPDDSVNIENQNSDCIVGYLALPLTKNKSDITLSVTSVVGINATIQYEKKNGTDRLRIEQTGIKLHQSEGRIDRMLYLANTSPTSEEILPTLNAGSQALRSFPLYLGKAEKSNNGWGINLTFSEAENTLFELGFDKIDLADEQSHPIIWESHSDIPLVSSMPMTRTTSGSSNPLYSRSFIPRSIENDGKIKLKYSAEGIPHDYDAKLKPKDPLLWEWPNSQSTEDVNRLPYVTMIPVSVPGIQLVPAAKQNNLSSWKFALNYENPLLFELYANASLPEEDKEDPGAPKKEKEVKLAPTALHPQQLKGYWKKATDKLSLTRVRASYATDYIMVGATEIKNLYGKYVWDTTLNFIGTITSPEKNIGGYVINGIKEPFSGSSALKGLEQEFSIEGKKLVPNVDGEIAIKGNSPDTREYDASIYDNRDFALSVESTRSSKNIYRRYTYTSSMGPASGILYTEALPDTKCSTTKIKCYLRDLPLTEKGNQFIFKSELENGGDLLTDDNYSLSAYEWRFFSKNGQYGINLGDFVFYPKQIESFVLSENLTIDEFLLTGSVQLKSGYAPIDNTLGEDPASLNKNKVTIELTLDENDEFIWVLVGNPKFKKSYIAQLHDGGSLRDIPINYSCKINSKFLVEDEFIDLVFLGEERTISHGKETSLGIKSNIIFTISEFNFIHLDGKYRLYIDYSLTVFSDREIELLKVVYTNNTNDTKRHISLNWLGGRIGEASILGDDNIAELPEHTLDLNHSTGSVLIKWENSNNIEGAWIINQLCDNTEEVKSHGCIQLYLNASNKFVGISELELIKGSIEDVNKDKWYFKHDLISSPSEENEEVKLISDLRVSSPLLTRTSCIQWPQLDGGDAQYIHQLEFKLQNHFLPIDDILGVDSFAFPWNFVALVVHRIFINKEDATDESKAKLRWRSAEYISLVHLPKVSNTSYSYSPRYKQATNDHEPNPTLKAGISLEEWSNLGVILKTLSAVETKALVFVGGGSTMAYKGSDRTSASWLSMPWITGSLEATDLDAFTQSTVDATEFHDYDQLIGAIPLNDKINNAVPVSEEDEFLLLKALDSTITDKNNFSIQRKQWTDFLVVEQNYTDEQINLNDCHNHPFFIQSIRALNLLLDEHSPTNLETISYLTKVEEAKRHSQVIAVRVSQTKQGKQLSKQPQKELNVFGENGANELVVSQKRVDHYNIERENDLRSIIDSLQGEFVSVNTLVLKTLKLDDNLYGTADFRKNWIIIHLKDESLKLSPAKTSDLITTSHALGWPYIPNNYTSVDGEQGAINGMPQKIGAGKVIQGERLAGREHTRFYPALALNSSIGLAISLARKVMYERPVFEGLSYNMRTPRHLTTSPNRIRLADSGSIKQSLDSIENSLQIDNPWLSITAPMVKRTTLGERPGALFGVTDQIVSRSEDGEDLDKHFSRFGVVGDSSHVVAQQLRAPRAKAYPLDVNNFSIRRSTYFGSSIEEGKLKSNSLFKAEPGRATFFRLYEPRKVNEYFPDENEQSIERMIRNVGPMVVTLLLSGDNAIDGDNVIDREWGGKLKLEMLADNVSKDEKLKYTRCYLELGNSLIDMKVSEFGDIPFGKFDVTISSFKEIQKVAYELSMLRMNTPCRLHFIFNVSGDSNASDDRHVFIDVPVEASSGYFHLLKTASLMFGDPAYDRKLGTPASQCTINKGNERILCATDRKQYDISSVIYLAVGKFDPKEVKFSEENTDDVTVRVRLIRDIENLEKGEASSIDLFVDCDWLSKKKKNNEEGKTVAYTIKKTQLGVQNILDLKKLSLSEELQKKGIPVKLYGKDKLSLLFQVQIDVDKVEEGFIMVEIVSAPVIAPPSAVYSFLNYRENENRSEVVLHATAPMPTNIEFPNLIKDLAVGYVRRSGLFIWNYAIKDDSENYYLVKMDRSGGAQLPDSIGDFIKLENNETNE